MPSKSERPIRVLHLEDSARDADIIGHKLESGGITCEIVVAPSRESFEAALAHGVFDVVLCDYNVPGYDGLTALKRAKEVRPDAPVIIISGSVGEEEAVRCLHTGATDYLFKERLERLVPAVSRAIQEAAERRSRSQAEEALQERERRLSSIYETVADILFYIGVEADGGYRFISVNRAFLSATGLRDDQVVGKRIEEVIPSPSLDLVLGKYRQAIDERQIVRWEETSEYPNGRLTGEVSVAPVFDAAGACTHLVGAVHDVTERRKLEAQLRQSQKMESVGQLAGGIAHDFNNLLTVIDGMAELALLQIPAEHRQLREDVQEIRRAGERAAALTRQLLAFSRKQILQPQLINLSTIVADLGHMLRRLLGEDVRLIIVPSEQPANAKADRGQIEQVIMNLAVNAKDAMPRGGTLTIEAGVCDLDEEFGRQRGFAVRRGRYVTLVVTDTGCGMDEATRRQIFEPFFTTKGPGQGTGLGLSTVYGIVKQSDGFILVESQPECGSRFAIYLPHAERAATSPHVTSNQEAIRGSETVLVVEDVIGLRRLVTRALESAGYKVLTAATGEDALSVLRQCGEAVHLLLTDVVMPGMSGRELAESVGRTHPETKIVYMSGYTDDVIVRHGILEEGTPFVHKPFAIPRLLQAIRAALDSPEPCP